MNLTVFGATGHVGQELVSQALGAGHTVTVLVRNPEKLSALSSRVNIVQGDVTDSSVVNRVIEGSNAVLNTLGHVRGGASDMLTVAASNIVKAMSQHGTRRLVVLTNTAVSDPADKPTGGQKFQGALMGIAMGQINKDHIAQAQVLADSTLDWTIVRAVILADGSRSGKYKVGKLDSTTGSRIARADVADFMLSVLTSDQYLRSMPVISQ